MPRPRRVSASPAGNKILAGPPAAHIDLDPRIEPIPASTRLFRIYAPEPYGTEALTFRQVDPLARFDHHRPGRRGSRRDRGRGILYAGANPLCCVGEYFGDQGAVTKGGNHLVRLHVTRDLAMLDLRGAAATGAGTIPAIGGVGERDVTQAWARWWYEHPQLGAVDGLLYTSGQSGEDALALWERGAGKLEAEADWDLLDVLIRDDFELAAHMLHLPIL